MSETTGPMDFNALVMISSAEYQRLARTRERLRRERKVELYSHCARKHKNCK